MGQVQKAKACKKCKKVHTVKKVKKAKAKPKKKAKKKVKTKKAKNCPYCGVSKIKCKCGPICNCPPGKCTCNVIEQATNITPLATCEKCGTRLEDGACPICAEEEEGITEEKHAKSKWCPHCKMKITKCRCVI